MAEREIRYCTTEDGVDIAYAISGSGPSLVLASSPPWSALLGWELFGPTMYQPLADNFQLVQYDSRGSGYSDHNALDFSVEAMTRDMRAVVRAAALERFALLALVDAVPPALQFASEDPEAVTHLIVCDGWTRPSDYRQSPAAQVEEAIREKDWVLYSETFTKALWDFGDNEIAQAVASYLRASCSPEALRAAYSSFTSWDVTACLTAIQAATLVLHNKRNSFQEVSGAQRIAARVPNARLVMIDDTLWVTVAGLTADFVAGKPTASAASPPSAPESGLRTVLFTDLVGHTEMMSRLGDEKGREVLREHERITREVLKANGGTEVKTMGDGFMASFGSVTKAVECAVALQKAFAEREGEPLNVRVGLNAGEPIEENGDLFGATVILASRIAAKADGGEILVSDNVRSLCSGKGFLFADRGEFVAKGFEEPVRVYEVSWRAD